MTDRTILITAALVFGAALLAAPVTAQPARTICAAHDIVVARLAERFGERRQSIALASDGAAVETFIPPETCFANPRANTIMASVAMNGCTRSQAVINPDTHPHAAPTAMLSGMTAQGDQPQ